MTSSEALGRAKLCGQLANQIGNPMKRKLLLQIQQAWLYLAADGRMPKEVELEAEQLLEVQAALLRRPSNIAVETGSAYCH